MADGNSGWVQAGAAITVALIGGAVTLYVTNRTPAPPPVPPTITAEGKASPIAPQGKSEEVATTSTSAQQAKACDDSNPPRSPTTAIMDPLQAGINLQGCDFSSIATTSSNAADCAELCRTNVDCRAMTFVVSRNTCWLKRGVPQPAPIGGPDYVSAVKQ